MTIETINPQAIQESAKKKGFKGMSMGPDSGFNAFLDAAGAMGPAAMTAQQMYSGKPNGAAVLGAAFSGIAEGSAQMGSMGGTPSYAGGMRAMGSGGLPNPNAPVGGANNFSQMDMINTMNSNNLGLLELQAVMQNNMQAWNTKSNILSADHRARMAMIEKFTARG